ncbi:MAG: CpXC domain-containing protein [Anaerolineaceae bacterium]
MAQTRTTCPRCHQPVIVDVEQLFDMTTDPTAKQRLLSGSFNIVQCQSCGYVGNLSTPIVYHDADKELLLTFFPPEMGLPLNEQEKLMGPLITQVVNRLPNEKRKGYLFRPQTMLTFQGMIERILEGDGITHDMLQAQQQKLNLLQNLLTASPDDRVLMAQREDANIDEQVFSMLNQLIEAAISNGDQNSAQTLADLQGVLVENTTVGKKLKEQNDEAEAAVQSLKEASKTGLTREKLLDLIVAAPTEVRLVTLASLTRSGLDYNFFQILTERIDSAAEEEKAHLIEVREKLLKITQTMDEQARIEQENSRKLLDAILAAPNTEEAALQNVSRMTPSFLDLLKNEMESARKDGNLERIGKLQKIVDLLQKLTAPPPEYGLVEELLSAADDTAIQGILDAHQSELTPEFVQLLAGLSQQAEAEGQAPEVVQQLQNIQRLATRTTMRMNLQKPS